MSRNEQQKDFEKLLKILMVDESILRSFISDPECLLANFSLSEDQRLTLIARNAEDLEKLGLSKAPPPGISEEIW